MIMANNTDTVYRIYGSTETIIKIAEKITSGMTLRKAVKVVGYKEPDVTKELAASIRLYYDFTPTGGIAHSNEHLDEFMEEQKIPYGIPLERVNTALKECGITPVHTDNFNMRGTIYYVESSDDYQYVDISSEDAWSEQQDFITALKQRFKDDKDFRIEFRCEEPGCDYYVSNVAGAIYGEYVSDLDNETENHETFEELCEAVTCYLKRNSVETPAQWDEFSDLHEFCDTYNETNPDHPIFVHEFTIVD